jgi:hypothetical protein
MVFSPQSHGIGAKKVELPVQGISENVAEMLQLFPFAAISGKLKFNGEEKGGEKVWVDPQAVKVNVPVLGGLLKTKTPSKLYKLLEQTLGTPLILSITHEETLQEVGAVKLVVAVQLAFAENTVVTVQFAPSAVKSENE